ncbi:hypothetical protein AX15_003815 [Amanita polypyramis BW_CC]|nr:hypothetical protein AX15_003815 [Amanita polypyramis BW_CC]
MQRSISTCILGILLASSVFVFETKSSALIVDLGYAKYAGVVNATSHNTYFLGIRYADPPTGNLRWRAPQPPTPIPGIELADTQPLACYNFPGFGLAPTSPFRSGTFQTSGAFHVQRSSSDALPSSEDCLFLNVFTPETDPSELLPVLVFIHGGGYQAGSTAEYNGDNLVELSGKRMVVVTIQYRLGVFGFLPGGAVKEGGDLNVGLLDQHFALQWVQEHIGKFGGDPRKVTIWGSSAGAGSVLQHVIAHNGNTQPPLFRGVIVGSLFLPSQYKYDDPISEALYDEVVSQTGCSSSSNSLECLRNTDVTRLQNANTKVGTSVFYGTHVFVPVVDGTFITQRPTLALRAGKVNGKMLLGLTVSREGNILVNQSTADITNYIAQLFPLFGGSEIEAVVREYSGLGSPADQANSIMTDATFLCPTYYMMRAFPGRAFKSEYAVSPAYHGMDEAYYFPSTGGRSDPSFFHNEAFIDAFGQVITDFTLSLNPNIKMDPTNIMPRWDRWRGRFEMLFDKTEADAPLIKQLVSSAALLKRCRLWESLGALSSQ